MWRLVIKNESENIAGVKVFLVTETLNFNQWFYNSLHFARPNWLRRLLRPTAAAKSREIKLSDGAAHEKEDSLPSPSRREICQPRRGRNFQHS